MRKIFFAYHYSSSFIYNYKFQCDVGYIERTNQWLESRIDQEVHAQYENIHTLLNISDSNVLEHFMNNPIPL